ncbi:hypothetical protein HZH68_010541 [Vespula germanica]|uniref:Uncharacterized protein n=1 Tax=Vespula germanica TaxID=30212 RepID=A0A834N290_VESGE|nr:hypothetical protein HZH68_010541 [Vespula germanica]
MAVNGDTLRTASVEPTMEEREVHSPLYWLYLWNENFKEHEGCDRSRHVQQSSKSQRVFKEVERDLVSRNVHSKKKIQRKEPRVEDDGKVEERIASYRIGEEKRKEHGGQVLAERYVLYTDILGLERAAAAATRARARGRTHRNAGEPAAGPEAGPTNDQPVHSEEDA